MIKSTLEWIERVNFELKLYPKSVIDIGSKDHNDRGGAKNLFRDSWYIGFDIEKGNNVDVVGDAYYLDRYFDKGTFEAVLCLHFLEHCARPWDIFRLVDYLLRDGGLFYVAMPTVGFPVHNYPGDYWRVTEQGMKESIMEGYEILSIETAYSEFGKHPYINCLGRARG